MKYKRRDFTIANVIFILLWAIPVFFFMRDYFSIESIIKIIGEKKTYDIFIFSFSQALISTVAALIVSIIPAYYISKRNNLVSKAVDSLIFIPYFFPPVSMVISFGFIYSSKGIIEKITGVSPGVMYTFWAIIAGNVFYNTPIFVKYISESIRRVPNEIIESGMTDGAGKTRIFLEIELPMIAQHIFKGFLIVFTYCFTGFVVILALGGIKYSNFEIEIANIMRNGLDFNVVAAYAIIQFVVLIFINGLVYKKSDSYYDEQTTYNGKIHILIKIGIVFYFIYEASIIVVSLLSSIFNFYENRFDITGLKILFSIDFIRKYRVVEAFMNSGIIAVCSGIIVISTAYLIIKNKGKYGDLIIMSAMGISSAFLGAAIVYFGILFDIPSWIMLVSAYGVIFTPVAYIFMSSHFSGIDKSILEAAKIDGAGKLSTFIHIEIPIFMPILVSAFLQIAAISFGEFTIAYTMQIQDTFPLVSTLNFSLESMRKIRESSAMSSITVIIIFILFFISNILIFRSSKNKKT